MSEDEMNMPSDFVANTMRNCDEMLSIIKHMNVFMNNYDKLVPFTKSLNKSFETYTDDSMNAIRKDLIKIAKQSINWKKQEEKIENVCNHIKDISNDSIEKSSLRNIYTITLKKPSYESLSNESILKMIETKDIDTKDKGDSFIENKKIFKKQLKSFPKAITKFENQLVFQRNSNVNNVKKIIRQLINEHMRYIKCQLKNIEINKVDKLIYVDSQKEFVEKNLKHLIAIS